MAYKEQMAQTKKKESFWTSRPDFCMELQLLSHHSFSPEHLAGPGLGQELFHPELTLTTTALGCSRAGERYCSRLH